jgi:putative membrane protein
MARRRDHEPLRVERTRTSSTWVSISVAIVFLVLLIIFIAQNDRKVQVHFLGASGTVSEALALIAAAVGGAVLVLAVGAARIMQLRLGGRRHNKLVAQRQDAADSASAAAVGGSQPVQPEN